MYESGQKSLDRVGGCFRVASRRNGANFPIPLSIMSPPQALRVGDACTTSLRLRAGRFATVEAATRVARLRSDAA